jgi:hypothetical protein
LSRFGVTYRRVSGSDDWIYCTLYIHTIRDYRQYSAIAVLHTFQFTVAHALEFSVFTSRILATDLSQSHWHLNSHIESSFHSVTPFFYHYSAAVISEDSTQFNSSLPSSYPGRLVSRNSTLHSRLLFSARLRQLFCPAVCGRTLPYNHFARTTRKTQSLF